jgi:hypothetical protein
MHESDRWDGRYERIAGPVKPDSTGTLIQKIGDRRYALFGSRDRKIRICTYPTLEPLSELNVYLPPWNAETNGRVWPNVVPLPPGYPARYIALMMDRLNFPGVAENNWTYGALYLYHAESLNSKAIPYEYPQRQFPPPPLSQSLNEAIRLQNR